MIGLAAGSTDVLFDRASDKVLDRLRRLIIALELAPGTLLVEARLMELLGCGRTPLREALQRLHEEYLVVALPRRAMSVADITVAGLQQIYEARWSLEPTIGRLAAERVTDEQLARLRALLADPRPVVTSAAPFDVTEWDMSFHRSIAEACANRYLIAAFERIQGTAQRLLVFAYRRGPFVPPTLAEHQSILDALERREPELVARCLSAHIHSAKDRILQTI